jgi:Holliday junction resolvasome RuvABC ATP-dependent DNA helicase subunit
MMNCLLTSASLGSMLSPARSAPRRSDLAALTALARCDVVFVSEVRRVGDPRRDLGDP